MRVKLKGVNSLTKTLADGKNVTYYYAWKGGPRLSGKPGTPEFVASFHAAHAADRPRRNDQLFESVIDRYQDSDAFRSLAPRTHRDYTRVLKVIKAEFGTMNIAALKQREARGVFREWRDGIAKRSPCGADQAWRVAARVMSWALDGGLIDANPCEKGGRVYSGSRAEKTWSEADEAAFMAVARPEIRLGLLLALWTGQRNGDLLKLPWSGYDGRYIRLQQNKTGRRVIIPVGAPLKAALDALPRESPIIMLSSARRPWTEGSFRVAWHRTAREAGIKDRTFHDLRGTAVLHLALAGATVPEIATFTGHSLSDVQTILDASYFHRDVALAESAVRKLDARKNSPNRFPN